ncbi:Hypothetical protein I5071_63470 [Sandaracinus amylolyticus]|nr:Hypothetical protein I5071_63470 [Sandaracinus amylolyticus]
MSWPGAARAYRTYEHDSTVAYPARWARREIAWELSTAELDGRLDAYTLQRAAVSAFATWESAECMPIDAELGGVAEMPARAGDGRNTIGVVSSGWVERGFPAGRGATTDVRLSRSSDGVATIVEADIYLNLADYEFAFGSASAEVLDVQAVLTHEIGHLLGLLHPCEHGGTSGAPDCAGSEAYAESAVYPTYEGESARTLGADDVAGLCALYASSAACSPACAPDHECVDGRCVLASCADGGCSSACDGGVCAVDRCDVGTPCETGTCAIGGAARGGCVEPGSTGAPCAVGEECESGRCVSSESQAGYCTVDCATDDNCAPSERCALVAGRRVCAPRAPAQTCAVGAPRARAGWVIPMLAMLALVLVVRARALRATRTNRDDHDLRPNRRSVRRDLDRSHR